MILLHVLCCDVRERADASASEYRRAILRLRVYAAGHRRANAASISRELSSQARTALSASSSRSKSYTRVEFLCYVALYYCTVQPLSALFGLARGTVLSGGICLQILFRTVLYLSGLYCSTRVPKFSGGVSNGELQSYRLTIRC